MSEIISAMIFIIAYLNYERNELKKCSQIQIGCFYLFKKHRITAWRSNHGVNFLCFDHFDKCAHCFGCITIDCFNEESG